MKWFLNLIGLPSPYMILAVIAVGTGLFFFGRYEGGHAQRLEDSVALADARAKAIVQMKAADQITFQISTAAETKLAEIHQTTLNLILKVPDYVSKDDDARCVVPRGFVRLHDAAAGLPSVPSPASEPNGAPSAVALSTIGSTVAANYGQCRAEAEHLTALQKWITDQRALTAH